MCESGTCKRPASWAGVSVLEERELEKTEEDARELGNEGKMKATINI